ncbi:MAG: hypothetical protein IJC38_04895 [Erysipelotrichaceae bacterium]|nr:hypothetical protein [Erysipelotrichaceae bacterium]
MEKTLAGVAALIMGIMGGIWFLVGLVNWMILPEPGNMIGAVFALIGAVFVIMSLMLIRMSQKYRQRSIDSIVNGRKIQAEIIEVKTIYAIRVNRRHPHVVVCEAEGRIFESEYFYHDVNRFDERETIDVYLDDQSGDYYVDLDS